MRQMAMVRELMRSFSFSRHAFLGIQSQLCDVSIQVTRGVRKETHEMKNGWTGLLNGMDYWNAKWTNMFYSFVNQAGERV